jgi:hypothetical protein
MVKSDTYNNQKVSAIRFFYFYLKQYNFSSKTLNVQVPQKLCGPAGCGFVPGPEQCIEKVNYFLKIHYYTTRLDIFVGSLFIKDM